MTARRLLLMALVLALVPAASTRVARAAVKPGLEGAQELFRQNHWEEARRHLRAQWPSLPEKDRPAATFLIGRSHVREAEFYRALRQFGSEAGLSYLDELAAAKANRSVAWIGLFRGLYLVDADRNAEAERALLPTAQSPLFTEWRPRARLRRALALYRLGRQQEAATALKDPSPEGRFCALLASGAAETPAASPKDGRREKLLRAALLFRAGNAAEAEAVVSGLDLDLPDVEDKSDPKKLLRFYDPLLGVAWERVCWERAVVALKPLAVGGGGIEKALAAYYVGLSLFRLGAVEEATRFLKDALGSALGPDLQPSARLLLAASAWKGAAPAATELTTLWDATQTQPEAVVLWDELTRGDLAKAEPFATKLEARLRDLLQSPSERPSGLLVGKWGLARLRRGHDPGTLVTALSEYRDKSNKNKLEWNDPLLLLALSVAHSRDQEYAQALETLFELSKTLPGLRAVQWNVQGIYAARQKAGGEARISQ